VAAYIRNLAAPRWRLCFAAINSYGHLREIWVSRCNIAKPETIANYGPCRMTLDDGWPRARLGDSRPNSSLGAKICTDEV
jgi:hypothetical protein